MTGSPLADALVSTITRHRLLVPGERVLVAVSGGVDSMVMLHTLHRQEYQVEAAHFDHQTRNGASAADAAFVKECCAQLNIPFHATSEAIEQNAKDAGKSFEGYARERRYAFLLETAARLGGIAVATAHHEDDQAETMLMGILGMASGFGLSGIAPVYEQNEIRIVRPLLECSRAAIETYAFAHKVVWREDCTNEKTCCTRNRVRLELLPLLETYNPEASRALARLADIMRTDGDYLDDCANTLLDAPVLDRSVFRKAPEALQRRMLKLLARRVGVNLSYERIISAIPFVREADTGKCFDLGNGASLYSTSDKIFLRTSNDTPQNAPLPCVPLNVPGETQLPGCVIHTRFLPVAGDIRSLCSPTKQYFDADKLTGELWVRSRNPGDRIIPLGMEHARKIQDTMVDSHIPSFQRDSVPLVLMDAEILWVAGYTRSSLARVDDKTTRLLEIDYSGISSEKIDTRCFRD